MDYKEETLKSYNAYAKKYENIKESFLETYLLDDVNFFLKLLSGKKILDVGCGNGQHGLYFKERGFDIVCIDNSKSMIELCKDKGLKAYEMDFEKLTFEKSSFDGVWAYTSLLHIPKSNLPPVLDQIKELIKPDGLFFIGMKEGNNEGFETRDSYPNSKRYFALYSKDELLEILEQSFTIIHFSRIKTTQNRYWLNFVCKKI